MSIETVKALLRTRLGQLEIEGQNAEDSKEYLERELEKRNQTLDDGQQEANAILAVLSTIEAAFPPPVPYYDDIPF